MHIKEYIKFPPVSGKKKKFRTKFCNLKGKPANGKWMATQTQEKQSKEMATHMSLLQVTYNMHALCN